MGVGKTLVVATKAIAKASPEMAEAIKNGDMTVSAAEKKLKESGALKSAKKPAVIKKPDPVIAPSNTAMHCARLAKSQLERIKITDDGAVEALTFIIEFATNLLNNNKA